MIGCSSTTVQTEPICPPNEYPVIEENLLKYPEEMKPLDTNNPKEAILTIVENNNSSAQFRAQLIQLINKIKTIQNIEVDKDGI